MIWTLVCIVMAPTITGICLYWFDSWINRKIKMFVAPLGEINNTLEGIDIKLNEMCNRGDVIWK